MNFSFVNILYLDTSPDSRGDVGIVSRMPCHSPKQKSPESDSGAITLDLYTGLSWQCVMVAVSRRLNLSLPVLAKS